jgi:hypothetical protein
LLISRGMPVGKFPDSVFGVPSDQVPPGPELEDTMTALVAVAPTAEQAPEVATQAIPSKYWRPLSEVGSVTLVQLVPVPPLVWKRNPAGVPAALEPVPMIRQLLAL